MRSVALVLAFVLSLHQDAPPVDQPTALGSLVAALEEEIAHFAAIERGADERQRVTIRASLNWRIVTAELLAQGEDAGEAGRTSVLLGQTLAAGRGAIDAMLITIHRMPGAPRPEGEELNDSAQELVRIFNEVALARGSRLRTLESLELRSALAEIVAPLVEASSRLGSPPSPGHWLRRDHEGPSATQNAAHAEDSIDILEGRTEAAALSPAARGAVEESIAFLRRGARFDDLSPAVTLAIDRLSGAIDLAEAIERAQWLGEESREQWRQRLDAALATFRDPASRDVASESLERLGRAGRLIARLDEVDERRSRLTPLVRAIDEACAAEGESARAADASLARLEMIIDRMVAYRAIEKGELPRDLAPAAARLREGYERAERSVIDQIDLLLTGEGATSDPAATSLLAAQAQHLEDLERLARLPEQSRTLSAINARFAGQIALRTRRLGQWLADPAHRDEARTSLDRLTRDLDACQPFPFERQLTERDAVGVAASGGRCAELLEVFRSARLAWVEAWAQAEIDPAPAARLERLVRFARMMAESSEIVAAEDGTAFLNAWSLWEMPDSYQSRAVADRTSRLELATAAIVEGNVTRFNQELDALEREAPLARTIGRLRAFARPALAPLPGDAAGTLGQVASPMPHDAWLGENEALLAELCRCATEVDDALARGLADRAAEQQARVDALAEELLAKIDQAGAPAVP